MAEILAPPAAPAGWRICPTCPAEDNCWPVESFAAWERATTRGRPKVPICNACLFARYPKVYKPCATCGTLMFRHSQRTHDPRDQCRRCARPEVPTCASCRESIEGRASVGGLCIGCSIRMAVPEVACA